MEKPYHYFNIENDEHILDESLMVCLHDPINIFLGISASYAGSETFLLWNKNRTSAHNIVSNHNVYISLHTKRQMTQELLFYVFSNFVAAGVMYSYLLMI